MGVVSYELIRANALNLPLADNSVDLCITSPPYFALRAYQDQGEVYDGQIGSEATPQAFLEALWVWTAECRRVLKPSGSLWVNLGDKYAGGGGYSPDSPVNVARRQAGTGTDGAFKFNPKVTNPSRAKGGTGKVPEGMRAKSLMGLPWRYAIGCIDQLGLICRAEVIWSKPNGLPESVTDRVRRSHEQWFMFTKEPRYFSAVDEVREPTQGRPGLTWDERKARDDSKARYSPQNGHSGSGGHADHVLGKLPGSVWTVPTEPLRVPDHLGVDHFAAFPSEFPRRIILGWSPSGVCVACGEGRRPVVEQTNDAYAAERARVRANRDQRTKAEIGSGKASGSRTNAEGYGLISNGVVKSEPAITGYACACPDTSAPTTPAVVLDPFCGTGTTPAVAHALGRHGIGIDLSADYLRLAEWRCNDPALRAKVLRVDKPKPVPDGQLDIFGGEAA